jgi:hypothetical protein
VYDFALGEGQYVNSIEEIDLEKVKKNKERTEYERLKKKFEEVSQDAGPSKADSSNQEPDGRAGHAAQSAQTTI